MRAPATSGPGPPNPREEPREPNLGSLGTVAVGRTDSLSGAVESYDSLALCPGASPVTPPLPGVDHPDIHVLRRIGDMDVIKAAVDGRGA